MPFYDDRISKQEIFRLFDAPSGKKAFLFLKILQLFIISYKREYHLVKAEANSSVNVNAIC